MKKTLSFLILITALMFGCKKGNNEQPEKVNDSWQPVTKGSYRKYDNTAKLTSGTSVRTMTGETQVFNGKTYYAFTSVNDKGGTQSAYYGQNNGDYFLYEVTPGIGAFETLYLKENAAVGEIWFYDAANLNGVKYRIAGKTVEKDIAYLVGGKTYNNVIHTQLVTQYSSTGSDPFTNVQTLNYYLVKGIGIIEAGESTGASGIKLMEYSIK
jgi:hypothetical protein